MSKPLLSICVPTYHRGRTAYNSIKKILENDADFIEVVVSDNASPDDTRELLSQIKDKRLKYYRNETNIGVPNIIESIMRGEGKWCMLISDEDRLFKTDWDRLKEELEVSSDVGIFRANCYNPKGELVVEGPYEKRMAGSYEAFQYIRAYGRYLSGMMFRRSEAEKYFSKVDKDSFFYYSYVHVSLALHYAQDWAVDRIDEINLIEGPDSDTAYTDTDTVTPKKSATYWEPEGRIRQEIGAIDVWKALRMSEETREKLILHTGVSGIKMVSNTAAAVFDETVIKGGHYSSYPEKVKKYRAFSAEDWENLLIESKKKIEKEIFSCGIDIRDSLIQEYNIEMEKLLEERVKNIREVLKNNGRL